MNQSTEQPMFQLSSGLETDEQENLKDQHEQGVPRLWKKSWRCPTDLDWKKRSQAGGVIAEWLNNMTDWPDLQKKTYTTSLKVLITRVWRTRRRIRDKM